MAKYSAPETISAINKVRRPAKKAKIIRRARMTESVLGKRHFWWKKSTSGFMIKAIASPIIKG